MKAQCFYFPETNRRSWPQQVARGANHVEVTVPQNATLPQIVAKATQAGLPSGTQRSGLFEVQTDAGIWHHHKPEFRARGFGKLDLAKATFQTWDQLEKEAA